MVNYPDNMFWTDFVECTRIVRSRRMSCGQIQTSNLDLTDFTRMSFWLTAIQVTNKLKGPGSKENIFVYNVIAYYESWLTLKL